MERLTTATRPSGRARAPAGPAVERCEVGATLARLDRHLDRRPLASWRALTARGRIDEAEAGQAVLDQGDIDGEVGALLDELLGAVERIDQKKRGPRSAERSPAISSETIGISERAAVERRSRSPPTPCRPR